MRFLLFFLYNEVFPKNSAETDGQVTQAMNVDSTSMRKNLLQLLQSARSGSPAMDVFGQHDVVSKLIR